MLAQCESSSFSLHCHEVYEDGGSDDASSVSSCSTSSSISSQHERWERKRRPSDSRPGLPLRQASSHGLELFASNSELLSLGDSLTTFDSLAAAAAADGLLKGDDTDQGMAADQGMTQPLSSSDSLPLMPLRQNSGRQLFVSLSPLAPSERRIRRPPNRISSGISGDNLTGRLGPPSIPRRQASGRKQRAINKSLSMPVRPIRHSSLRSLKTLFTGSSAA